MARKTHVTERTSAKTYIDKSYINKTYINEAFSAGRIMRIITGGL
ncbi:wbfC domain protein [Vibrio anguillarum]|nr:wbfC domain protein [Vibrio anguillarum]